MLDFASLNFKENHTERDPLMKGESNKFTIRLPYYHILPYLPYLLRLGQLIAEN